MEDEGSSGGAEGADGSGSNGGAGGDASVGGGSDAGGAVGSGGTSSGGTLSGAGGGDNGCTRDVIDCPDGSVGCECPGVFKNCPFDSVHCTADEQGEPHNCICGEPDVRADDCDYQIQYRCEPLNESYAWLSTCMCDPVLPTDDEPCRYHQQAYQDAGFDYTCVMLVNMFDDLDKYKYSCSCTEAASP